MLLETWGLQHNQMKLEELQPEGNTMDNNWGFTLFALATAIFITFPFNP